MADYVGLESGGHILLESSGGLLLEVQPQLVLVPGVYPPLFVASITGGVICGGALVGGSSAAQFGAPVVKYTTTSVTGGVPSAQSFGVVTIHTSAQTVAIPGLGSAQAFGGTTAIYRPQTVLVQGITRPPPIPSITGGVICGDGHVVGGLNFLFGYVTILWAQVQAVPGLGSAQQFGTPTGIGGPVTIPIGVSCPSAQAFGDPDVFIVWLRSSACTDLDLALVACTDVDLEESTPFEFDLVPSVCS